MHVAVHGWDGGVKDVLRGIYERRAPLGLEDREGKILTLLRCRSSVDDTAVFNGGELIVFANRSTEFRRMALTLPEATVCRIAALYDGICAYKYRDGKPNRHLHSNDLPSYFGLGFPTLDAMLQSSLKLEDRHAMLKEYTSLHPKCCGVATAVVG